MTCGLIGRNIELAGESAPNNPCKTCIPQWVDGKEPDQSNLTPTLIKLQERIVASNKPPEPVKLPPLKTRILTAWRAFRKFIKSGRKLLTQEQVDARLAICASCNHKDKWFGQDICNLCGCMLKYKAQLPGEQCPIIKWPGDKFQGSNEKCCGTPAQAKEGH